MGLRKGTDVATSKTRVQNVTGDQTVKSSSGSLRRIILSNAAGTAQSLTVKDGSTTLIVLNIGATTTLPPIDLGITCTTSIVVNPSNAGIDALVIFD